MTVPKIKTYTEGDFRIYVDPSTGKRAMSVTSIGSMLAKPALIAWAGRTAAEFAVEHWQEIEALVRAGKTADAVRMIRAGSRSRDAADLGTKVHAACEVILNRMLAGESLDDITRSIIPGPTEEFERNFVEMLREFDAMPEYIEATIWNETVGYAGSLDNALRLRRFDNRLLLVDIKTGASGIWSDVALQLTGYAHGEYVIMPGGARLPMPEVDGAAALWLRPDGWALHPIDIGERSWNAFLGLKAAADWKRSDEGSGKVVRPPVNIFPLERRTWSRRTA